MEVIFVIKIYNLRILNFQNLENFERMDFENLSIV